MFLLFDIGGTKIRLAYSGDSETLQEAKSFDTPTTFDDAVSLFSSFKEKSFEKVVGGIAGVLDRDKTTLLRSPNLQVWVDAPIKNKLEEIFKTPVYLENDAALAGLGEACLGAGKDKKIVAYLTISTGIGGVRIVERKIDANSWGFEPGKQIIDVDLTVWPESVNFNSENIAPGSIESYASGAALNFRYGKPSSEIKDANVWREVENLLTAAIYNTIAYWSPETIVLGGSLVLGDTVSIDNIRNNLEKTAKIFSEIPIIKKAELADKSGLYGALSLAKTLPSSGN
jgi:glucokinase